jgi:hypothetical protein
MTGIVGRCSFVPQGGVPRGGGVKRWMVVVAMGLAALGGIVAPGAARAGSAAWSQVYQSGFSGYFSQVAAISTKNIWAVGDTYTAAGKPVYTPFVRHFDGSAWQAVTIPNGSGSTADWVSASAANNVWIGGVKNTTVYTSVVYRFDGANWHKIPMPKMTYLQGVVALAPNNVWAYGVSGTVFDDIFHWNGSEWQYYLSGSTNFLAQSISASAPNNVWVSGIAYSGSKQVAAAYRWDGSAWHAVSMPHPALYSGGPDVTALSPSNVWIGYAPNATDSNVLHWDGHQWHPMTVPWYAYTYNIAPDGKGGYWFGAGAILTGSTWTQIQLPFLIDGGLGDLVRIPGTTSFLLPTAAEPVNSSAQRPTIFQFDL